MTNWTSGICAANGIDIHYLRTGGSKPPLILLHGLSASGACWTPLARALEEEFDVVMPDARGHGTSSTPLSGYRYQDLALDVVGLIQGLELAAPSLLGHSMGGMTAAVVANHPGIALRAVVLVDPTFMTPQRQREVYESDVVEHHRRFLRSPHHDVVAQLRALHPHRSPALLDLQAEARLQTRVRAFDVLMPPNPEYHALVSTIRVPILLVIADRGVVSGDTARELQDRNRDLQVAQVPDAGHGILYDQPDRLAAVVRWFLRPVTTG